MKTVLATAAALAFSAGAAFADSYTVTVTNTLETELFAPIVLTDAANDDKIFTMDYVTAAAQEQILTGDPKMVVEAIGMDMVTVAHGEDGPPGVLLAPGKSVTFDVKTDATVLRVLAMVAPTEVPDHYVTGLIDLSANAGASISLSRFDIGHDEGTMMIEGVSDMQVGTVTLVKM